MKQKIKDDEDARITFNFFSEHNHELPGRILTYFEYDSNLSGADISENLIAKIMLSSLWSTSITEPLSWWAKEHYITEEIKKEAINLNILKEENGELYFSDKIVKMPIVRKGELQDEFYKRYRDWVGKYSFSNPYYNN
tara:strand:- start:103 stop:516 length:414 start_codon:yes stop_codon:yes gene_type:complete